MKPYSETYLEHYGVKGMRWGVRKDRPGGPGYNNTRGPAGKTRRLSRKQKKQARQSTEHKVSRRILSKKVSEMSNDELAYVNRRLSLESGHSALNPRPIKKGEKYAKRVVGGIGTATAIYMLKDNPLMKKTAGLGKSVVEFGKRAKGGDALGISRAVDSFNIKKR